MAILLNNTVGFKINTTGSTYVDLSSFLTNATLTQAFDEIEVTSMGDSSHRFLAGLQANTLTLDLLNDDTATTGVRAALQGLIGTTAACKMVQVQSAGSATVSTTNPLYTFSILVNNLTPINGAPQDVSMQSLSFTINTTVTVATTGTY